MTTQSTGWKSAFTAFLDRRALIMLFLGFSAGIPILLIFSSLSLWLGEAGIDKSAVTFFSWAALGYSFKFVWAPLIDELPVPILTKILGRRRACQAAKENPNIWINTDLVHFNLETDGATIFATTIKDAVEASANGPIKN